MRLVGAICKDSKSFILGSQIFQETKLETLYENVLMKR